MLYRLLITLEMVGFFNIFIQRSSIQHILSHTVLKDTLITVSQKDEGGRYSFVSVVCLEWFVMAIAVHKEG